MNDSRANSDAASTAEVASGRMRCEGDNEMCVGRPKGLDGEGCFYFGTGGRGASLAAMREIICQCYQI